MAADKDDPQKLVIRNTFWELKEDEAGKSSDEGARKFHTAPPGSSGASISATEPAKIDQLVSISEEQLSPKGHKDDGDESMNSTVMLRNLPVKLSRDDVLSRIDAEGFFARYDFFYMPIDFATMANFGYCFINLVTPEVAQEFWAHFDGFSKWPEATDGPVAVSWSAKHQGLEQNVERYRNCPVMFDKLADACRPVLLRNGVRMDFPPPTKKLRQPRVRTKKERPEGMDDTRASTEPAPSRKAPAPASTEPAYVTTDDV
ncbi:unnamed protein product [Prorocentrum cordatum]|uniref:Mei2-like C-terminal RNA recognition motif domain-containing protein n=1 Tax=Prorocentrum cordatum TaxID=2364126 RepID=A0ABN9UX39_9DINO|nr:unnamed protein product [Polarella glacialis]